MRRRVLLLLEVIVAGGAIPAGVSMVLNPARGGMPPVQQDWLEGSPFHDFLIPGLVLAGVIGLGCGGAAIAELRHVSYAGWLSLACGLVLCGWIVVQVTIVPFNFLQLLFLGAGAVIAGLAALQLSEPQAAIGKVPPPKRVQTKTAGH